MRRPAAKARAWRTPSARCSRPPTSPAALPEASAPSRPMRARRRRSISTVWCGTTTARESPELGELQINLAPRARAQRAPATPIALDLRARLKSLQTAGRRGRRRSSRCRPARRCSRPCWPRSTGRIPPPAAPWSAELKKIFASVPFIVDVDDSIGAAAAAPAHLDRPGPARVLRRRADATSTTRSRRCSAACRSAIRIAARAAIRSRSSVRLPKRDLAWTELLASTPVPANTLPGSKTVVELGDVVRVTQEAGSPTIFRRDGRFADMVMAELAGAFEAPIYGMLEVAQARSTRTTGAALPKPDHPLPRPAGGRSRSRRCCGTANGRSPT